MKRTIAAALVLTLLLATAAAGLGGCTKAQEAKTSIKVGVSVYDQFDTFIGELYGHLIEQARQREQSEQVTVTILRETADGNQATQNNQVESFIEAGCDVICVNLVDRTEANVIIDMAVNAGTPILFFNRELVEEDLTRSSLLYYVGAEALESGRLQGQIAADIYQQDPALLDKNGDGRVQYVMLEGEAGHQDAVVRTESAVATAADGGVPLERLEDEIANWIRGQAETKMARWLEKHGAGIELVFANNDDMALGAIDALKRADIPREEWPVVVGIDGTPVGLEAVKNGEMAGTVYNDAKGQAMGLLDIIFALEFGGEMPQLAEGRYLRLPYQAITAENVDEYLAKSA